MPGDTRLHAKIYASDQAVTIGSSNFTNNGLRAQFEANSRFTREAEPLPVRGCPDRRELLGGG
ncbi:MAG: phospholipase D family protein [Actinobacteria bacterium]|nr:phospholipase D family protein [Actinomycetota bacterium]